MILMKGDKTNDKLMMYMMMSQGLEQCEVVKTPRTVPVDSNEALFQNWMSSQNV
jgi:hypothetical protein